MTITSVAALPLPRSIYIEPTSRCNELCQQCARTLLSREDDRDLTFDEFRRTVDQFPVLERESGDRPWSGCRRPYSLTYITSKGTFTIFINAGAQPALAALAGIENVPAFRA